MSGARSSRRRAGASPAALASPLEGDDLLWEILLRLQPQPSSLRRVSVVCKRWRDLVADPRFLRSFSDHHRKPPLLGIFHRTYGEIVFSPMADPPDRIPPQRFDLGRFCSSNCYHLLDCRHGLALVVDVRRKVVVVCNPITGEQRCLAIPSELRRGYLEGAVLCASREHGHVHGGCHLSSYKVVLVSTGRSDMQCNAFVYSLETGVWGNLISTKAPYGLFYADPVPPALGLPLQMIYLMETVRSSRLRMALLATPYYHFLASKCGKGTSMVMVLLHGCHGRPSKCTQFFGSPVLMSEGTAIAGGFNGAEMLHIG